MLLVIAACLVLEALPLIAAARQMIHDHRFRPDFVIRVTEQDTSVACVTRFTTLINGWSILKSYQFQSRLYLTYFV